MLPILLPICLWKWASKVSGVSTPIWLAWWLILSGVHVTRHICSPWRVELLCEGLRYLMTWRLHLPRQMKSIRRGLQLQLWGIGENRNIHSGCIAMRNFGHIPSALYMGVAIFWQLKIDYACGWNVKIVLFHGFSVKEKHPGRVWKIFRVMIWILAVKRNWIVENSNLQELFGNHFRFSIVGQSQVSCWSVIRCCSSISYVQTIADNIAVSRVVE